MSAFDDAAKSVQGSYPSRLFAVAKGNTTWRFTGASVAAVVGGYTWLPHPIICGATKQTGDSPSETLSIQVPIDSVIGELFSLGIPDEAVSVTVFSVQLGINELRTEWKGIVRTPVASKGVVTLECDLASSTLDWNGLRPVLSKNCRHTLGDDDCGVDTDALFQGGPITALAGLKVTLLLVPDPGNLIGGVFKAASGLSTLIVDQLGNRVTLLRPIRSLAVGQTASVRIGCDLTYDTCNQVFHNRGRFGGAVGLVPENPMTGDSLV